MKEHFRVFFSWSFRNLFVISFLLKRGLNYTHAHKGEKINTVLRQLSTEQQCAGWASLVAAWLETAFSSRAAPQTWLSLERGKQQNLGKKEKGFKWKTKFAECHWSCGETQNWVLTIFQGQSCEVSNDTYNLPLANWPSGCRLCPPATQPCRRTGLLTPLAGWLESCRSHQGTRLHWVLPGSSEWQELFLLKRCTFKIALCLIK